MLKLIVSGLLSLSLLLSAACSVAPLKPAATKVITVTQTQYVPIPAPLTAPCPAADLTKVLTNKDMLEALEADSSALAVCNSQLFQIKKLGDANGGQ